jgi:hypothetical protein
LTSSHAATLSIGPPISLGPHHCGEVREKATAQPSRGKIVVAIDLSDTGRAVFAAECAARGGTYSPDRCPRADISFVCVSEAANATLYTILYDGSADRNALADVCGARSGFAGRRVFYGLRRRQGASVWGSCLVP